MKRDAMPMPEISDDQAAHYRREGYLVIPGVLPAAHVEACKAALSDLMQDRIPRRSTNIYYEAGQSIEGLSADERELRVRRLDSFCDDHPALAAAANSRRLHAALDQLSGIGRTLFQEMALVKPPGIGAAKPWHQDAAYFMLRDPSHVIGPGSRSMPPPLTTAACSSSRARSWMVRCRMCRNRLRVVLSARTACRHDRS